ncbi:MAG: hypothetical protein IJY92_03150 [Alphaproteobacteria bacterium]|nr:hypothetical protein [Alphaproteobacteria bacterium]
MSDVRNSLESGQSDGLLDFAYGLGHDTYALCKGLYPLKGEVHFGGEALQNVDMMQVNSNTKTNIDFRALQSEGR